MKNSIYIFLILFLSLKYIYLQTITIPFKRMISPDTTESDFYSNIAHNRIYTTLKIGTPSQEIKVQIKMLQFSLCVRNNTIYKYNTSSTYKKNGNEFSAYNADYYRAIPSNESIIIRNDDEVLNDIKFMLTTNSKYDLDGIFGLQIHENNYLTYGHGLINQLKLKKLINNEVFFFNYPTFDILYNVLFRSVYWDGKEIETSAIGKINIEDGYIIGSKSYEEAVYKFFQPHIVNKKCKSQEVNVLYTTYICDEYDNLNISSFPNLIFYNSDTNYNLTITYKDLFVKKGEKIYFMIVFDKKGYNAQWTLGSIVLRNNMIVFDMDKRLIGFYDPNNAKYKKEKLNTSLYIIFITIAGIIIIALIGFILYKFVWKKKGKKAYELNDDYDYNTAINN